MKQFKTAKVIFITDFISRAIQNKIQISKFFQL